MEVKAIFGPPGTGKTRTLVGIAQQEAKREARGVLYLSYTKAAAEEAVSRVKGSSIKPSTIHSMAFGALNMNRAAVVDGKKLSEFAIATGIPFKGSERGSDEIQEGDEYQTVLEFAHNRIIDHRDAWDLFGRPGTLARFENFVKSYTQWKETYGYMDFDDMLFKFTAMPFLNRASEVVILDEAQDCTPLQWLAIIKMCENAKRVYIAGDDDQAIYEWSGANPHGMIEFAEVNEGQTKVLDQSFRVPRVPFDVSQKIVEDISRRVDKKFNPRDAGGSVTLFGDFWDIDIAKYAKTGAMILVRDGWRRQEIQKELNRLLLPYDVLGGNSPWTNSTANALRNGRPVDIPPWWQEFYHQWDPKAEIKLQLSTVHQAKGREHKSVIVDLQCPTRVLANYRLNPDAERRVWYVAITRTSEELILCGENPVL